MFSKKECGICYEALAIYKYRKTNCNHIFCKNCWNKWFIQYSNITCPLCRSEVKQKTKVKWRVIILMMILCIQLSILMFIILGKPCKDLLMEILMVELIIILPLMLICKVAKMLT